MGTRPLVRPGSGSDRWFEIKSKIHSKLLSSLNPDQLRTLNKESVRAQIGTVVERLVGEEGIPMTLRSASGSSRRFSTRCSDSARWNRC